MVDSNRNRKNRKLRNLLINNEVQIRVITRGIIYMLLAIIFTGSVLLHGQITNIIFMGAGSGDMTTGFASASSFLHLSEYLVPLVLILIFFYILHLLVVTHRFCGPMVNFARTFRAVGDGDLSARITLRKNDYLKKESRIFNTMVSNLAQRIEAARMNDRVLIKKIDETIEELSAQGTDAGIRDSFAEVRRLAKENTSILSNFKC